MRDELAAAIAKSLREDDETGYVDDSDLDDVCIDGWFNMRAIADQLIAQGWKRSAE